ncbi:TPA: peptide chain release factor [Neisseria meningitidis]|uniref:peptide chain release factor n=1 Tax=Neisseria polysaccharea TaxID=489 RepID=UPI0027DFD476|nr:peptide chain release factor [Neisseria polysaccharea]
MPSETEKRASDGIFVRDSNAAGQNQGASESSSDASERVNLGRTQERWPDIVFHETREHSVKL